MSFNHFMPNHVKEVVKKQYQPLFPLSYSDSYGPYQPITSLEESIQKDFEYLLLTNPGEWPMKPDLGIGIKRYLFENYSSPELGKIQERVQSQLTKYLPFPYVQLISVNFNATPEDQDQGFITLNIRYSILSNLIRMMDITKDAVTHSEMVSNIDFRSYHGADSFSALKTTTSNMRNIP
jgi:phage baseplate assembly protein W